MLTLQVILASCARSHVASFLGTLHFLGTHTKLDYGYNLSGSPTSCGQSPGWDATEPPLGPTPGLVTGWLRADPRVPRVFPGTVPSQHHLQPGLSGFSVRTEIDLFRPEDECWTLIKEWAPDTPPVSAWKIPKHQGKAVGHSEKPLPGTAEEKWLEQKHWTMAAEALKWRVGQRGRTTKLKRPFYTLAQDPEAKTLVSTLSSDLSAPHTGSLHCATDVGHPNSSSCCWEAALDSQEPLISSEMEKQFQAIGSGSAVSSSDKVLHVISFPSLNITDVRLPPLRTTSGLRIIWHEYVWNHGIPLQIT